MILAVEQHLLHLNQLVIELDGLLNKYNSLKLDILSIAQTVRTGDHAKTDGATNQAS